MPHPHPLLVLLAGAASLVVFGCKGDAPPAPAVSAALASAAPPEPAPPPSAHGDPSPPSEPPPALSGSAPPGDPNLAIEDKLREARNAGVLGMLASADTTSVWGQAPRSASSNMWGDDIGDSFGAGGLGLQGIGESGGRGEGLGLGSIGTIDHGLGGKGSKPPSVRMGASTVSGRLPPEVIQRIVRQNIGRFRFCYENGLRKDPKLEGKVVVGFVIDREGSVESAASDGSTLKDTGVVSCVTKAFLTLRFPKPEGGVVKVNYPILFAPGDSDKSAEPAKPSSSDTGPKVAGKPLAEVTTADVEKALRDAGYTDISSEPKKGSPGAVVLTVKKDQKTFTITFVPAKAGAGVLDKEEIVRLLKDAAVTRDGAFFLAVEGESSAEERALLDAIVKKG
jgi:hypothetical protein